jgi:hypothetical protein
MKWIDRKICDFIMRVRDANPIGVNPHNPIAIGGKKVLVGDPPPPGSGSNTVGAAFRIENPTYWRWYIWPRNRFVNCYLHNFLRDDEEDLHDHRMINISVVLSRIGYREELFLRKPVPGNLLPGTYMKRVEFMHPRIRLPSTPHRVVLWKADGKPQAIWSLFVGFPHWRNWGFWCPGKKLPASNVESRLQYRIEGARWIPWETYVLGDDPTSSDYGTKGAGCDG